MADEHKINTDKMLSEFMSAADEAFSDYLGTRDFRSALIMIEVRAALSESPPNLSSAAVLLEDWEADFPLRD